MLLSPIKRSHGHACDENDPFESPPPKRTKEPSPREVHPPMQYHNYEKVVATPPGKLRRLGDRPLHGLAPGSAEKQFIRLKENFGELKEVQTNLKSRVQRRLFEDEEAEVIVESPEARFRVTPDSFSVESDGKERTFGVHAVVLQDGSTRERAYPKGGDGVVVLPGAEVVTLVRDYLAGGRTTPFKEFVHGRVTPDKLC